MGFSINFWLKEVSGSSSARNWSFYCTQLLYVQRPKRSIAHCSQNKKKPKCIAQTAELHAFKINWDLKSNTATLSHTRQYCVQWQWWLKVFDMCFSQTKLHFTIMGTLLATTIKSRKQKRHTGSEQASCLNSEHVSGLLHEGVVGFFTENTINGNVSTCSHCLLSQGLKIL